MLAVLREAPDVGAEAWEAQFQAMRNEPGTYYILVIVSRVTDQIVGSGSVFIERKFLRGLARAGHIEDIVVAREMQGKKLGLRIIQALTQISRDAGCYKTVLNCIETNVGALLCLPRKAVSLIVLIGFYEKCGYEKRNVEMVITVLVVFIYAC